jgi:hypothetical protein
MSQSTIQLLIGDTKVDTNLRYEAGVKIATLAPASTLYTTHGDLKTTADDVAAKNTALKAATDGLHTAEATLAKARTTVLTATADWDGAFDVYLSTSAKYCLTPDDAAGLGLAVRGSTHNPLAMPIAVFPTYSALHDYMRIRVVRAPGMDVVSVQVSPDPITATSWKELDGSGAIRTVPSPAVGTWWVRACSKTARANSDFTTPVSLIIK